MLLWKQECANRYRMLTPSIWINLRWVLPLNDHGQQVGDSPASAFPLVTPALWRTELSNSPINPIDVHNIWVKNDFISQKNILVRIMLVETLLCFNMLVMTKSHKFFHLRNPSPIIRKPKDYNARAQPRIPQYPALIWPLNIQIIKLFLSWVGNGGYTSLHLHFGCQRTLSRHWLSGLNFFAYTL